MSQIKHRPKKDSYLELVRRFPLRPIRDESQYDEAVQVASHLAVLGEKSLNAGERDYLDVLSDLIARYDEKAYPISSDDRLPHERLKTILEDFALGVRDLAELLQVSRPLASMLLSGRRKLTADHIRALSRRFKVDAGFFLCP